MLHKTPSLRPLGLLALALLMLGPAHLALAQAPAQQPTLAAGDDEAGEAANPCRIRARSDQQSGGGKRFSATEILDIKLRVRLRDLSGDHLLHLKLRTPNGHHYQTLTVPFSSNEANDGALRKVDGYPRPLKVQATRESTEGSESATLVEVLLPVAGTSIVHSSLYGRWEVRPYLDDDLETCGRRRRFFIDP